MSLDRGLGHIERTVLDDNGNPAANLSVEIRRQGATVRGSVSGSAPLTVPVYHVGAIRTNDQVAKNTGTTYNVKSVTESNETVQFAVELDGFAGSISFADGDRLSPTNNLPTLYSNVAGDNSITTTSNPIQPHPSNYAEAWLKAGSYDLLISADDFTTALRRDAYVGVDAGQGHLELRVTNARYGAKFDGVTDDTAAIKAALEDAEVILSGEPNVQGAAVILPKGIAVITEKLRVNNRVRLIGQGNRNTWLLAKKSDPADAGDFPSNTAMIEIGDGSSDTFGARLEHLGLDCNEITGSIGIESTRCQEDSGPFHCLIRNFIDKGIKYSTTGCQNFTIAHCSLFHASTNAIGIELDTSASNNRIYDCTITGKDPQTQSTKPAINLKSTNCEIVNCHVETHDVGVDFSDTNATGMVTGFTGHSTITSCVKINSNGVIVLDINQAGATNAIEDVTTGDTFTMNSGGFYFHTNDGGVDKTILSSDHTVKSRYNAPLKLAGTTSSNDALAQGVSSSVLALAPGNLYKVSASSPITVTTITATPEDNGREVVFIMLDSNVTFESGGNLFLQSPPLKPKVNDVVRFWCDGTSWFLADRYVSTLESRTSVSRLDLSSDGTDQTLTGDTGKLNVTPAGGLVLNSNQPQAATSVAHLLEDVAGDGGTPTAGDRTLGYLFGVVNKGGSGSGGIAGRDYALALSAEDVPKLQLQRPATNNSAGFMTGTRLEFGCSVDANDGSIANDSGGFRLRLTGGEARWAADNNTDVISFNSDTIDDATIKFSLQGTAKANQQVLFQKVSSDTAGTTIAPFKFVHPAFSGSQNFIECEVAGTMGFRLNQSMQPGIKDTGSGKILTIVPTSTPSQTADRTVTLDVQDQNRTITLQGNPTLNDWFDQGVKENDTPRFTRLGLGTAADSSVKLSIQGDSVSAPGTTTSPQQEDEIYGNDNGKRLADPDAWLRIRVDGNNYKIPLYS